MSLQIYSTNFLAVILISSAAMGEAQEESSASNLVAEQAETNIVTSNPGTFDGPSVADIIGADRFYDAGYTGQGTVTAVVEAGFVWSGHESLGHVTNFQAGVNAAAEFDRHATWVGSIAGGRRTNVNGGEFQEGIAFGTDLRSGAIAQSWSGNAFSNNFSIGSNGNEIAGNLIGGYDAFFGTAAAINSSWGASALNDGGDGFAVYIDGMAFLNRSTVSVASAGNTGANGTNTVGSPGSGFNSFTIGALTNVGNDYTSVAGFSSHGPNDYFDPVNGLVEGVRAAVDIAAPGDTLTAAFYGGQTGGNGLSLPGSTEIAGDNFYAGGIGGTSFSAPIVAGSVALLNSASIGEGLAATSRDSLVIQSVLQNSATKTDGWDNGQDDSSGSIITTQSLDFFTGAGAIDLYSAFDQYLGADITTDVAGQAFGFQGLVDETGWDLGSATRGGFNEYFIDQDLLGGSQFNVTLNWFRERTADNTFTLTDTSMADLTLSVFNLNTNQVIASSESRYNVTEHLSFNIAETGQYGIRVSYDEDVFNLGTTDSVDYGLAWSGVAFAIPEPTSVVTILIGSGILLGRRRR